MFAQQGDLFVMDVTKEDTLRQCAINLRKLHSHIHQTSPRLCKKFKPKRTRTLVIKLKMSTQLKYVQEMSVVHELKNPVFYTPVQPQIVTTIWKQISDLIMEPEVCVATPVEHLLEDCAFETNQISVITVHDMELKSAHYSNVTINGQVVQIKQDTGAEVNVMPKSMFDILSTSNTTKVLNKAKSMKISGYGENPIDYMGTCVFRVSHNNQRRDALFFITNIDDTKVILGAKTCQELGLVKIACDDWC